MQAKCRENELVLEKFVAIALIGTLSLLKVSTTNTIEGLEGIFTEKNTFLILLGLLGSFITIIQGSISSQNRRKNETIGLVGKVSFALYHCLLFLSRIAALVTFFVPSLGLFNLLHHFEYGKLPFAKEIRIENFRNLGFRQRFPGMILDMIENKNGTLEIVTADQAWKMIDSVTDLTGIPLQACFVALLLVAMCSLLH